MTKHETNQGKHDVKLISQSDEDSSLTLPYSFNYRKVVIVEDDEDFKNRMRELIETNSNYEVEVFESLQEVRNSLKESPLAYVLDVDLGNNRHQEGIRIAEEVMKCHPNAGVFFYFSAVGIDKVCEQRIRRLEPDAIFDKTDLISDCEKLVKAVDYRQEYNRGIESLKDYLMIRREYMENLEHLKKCYSYGSLTTGEIENDKAFRKYNSDENWRKTHIDNYVAFVDGEFVAKNKYRQNLLSQLALYYKDKYTLVAKVENNKNDEIMDEPASLWLDID